jgi:hypothetical protein
MTIYTIRYYQDGRPTGDEHWTGIYGEAKALAENAVSTGAADRVEIIDEAGQVAFEHPPVASLTQE